MKRKFAVDPWKVYTTTLDKEDKRLQESITSLGNGYMGMRGNFEETYSADHHQGIYLGGVWYPDKTRVGWWKNGYPEYFGKVINAMNFLRLQIIIDGKEVDLATEKYEDFYLGLDLQHGILQRHYTILRGDKKITLAFERFVSLTTKELCAVNVKITSDQKANVEIISYLDNEVTNEDANYDEMFWQSIAKEEGSLVVQTIPNAFGIEQFTVAANMDHRTQNLNYNGHNEEALQVTMNFSGEVDINTAIEFEKRIIVTTSRDYKEDEVLVKAKEKQMNLQSISYQELKEQQEKAWLERWKYADVEIEGSVEDQQGIRFNLFQLFSTYYGEDARLNIGPKGFTGEKYGGATYWDTEAYCLPLYLALTDQKVARNLLEYRFQQLPQAYHNARQQGLKGALYPMVTFTGVECHNEWEITFEEIHRNAAMVYAIYRYTLYTGDTSYLEHEGLEVMTGVARFWADRVHYAKNKGVYMIHGVTGPNEYENNVNNNWLTNRLAKWVLSYTKETLNTYAYRKEELGVSEDELAKWTDIIEHMYEPKDEEKGIFVQHDTFLDKDLMPVSDLAKEDLPLNQNWSWDKILRSCFIKQADVLQGLYYFNNEFTLEEKRRNFEFYEPMTVHESSLSPCIHAILAAELKKNEKAVELYKRTARLDLDNYNNDTEDGLHITSMTGSWLSIVEGFAGMRTFDGLHFQPFLPTEWKQYAFHINYRGRLLFIKVSEAGVEVQLLEGEPIALSIYDKEYSLENKLYVPLEK